MTGLWRLAQDYQDQLRTERHESDQDRDEDLAIALDAAREAREEQDRDGGAW